LKVIFRIVADAGKHTASFRVVERHVYELTGEKIDGSCKDVARLCFVSFDPDASINANATELPLSSEERQTSGKENRGPAKDFAECIQIAVSNAPSDSERSPLGFINKRAHAPVRLAALSLLSLAKEYPA
jgi:hypothetical protein